MDRTDPKGESGSVDELVVEKHIGPLSIINSIDEPVYVSDPATYEILFVNEALRKVFGEPGSKRCYEYLQRRDSPCPFCTNDIILGEKLGSSHIWEFKNEFNGRWYKCIDKAIPWTDGRLVRYEMAVDIDERKEAELALIKSEKRLSATLRSIGDGVITCDESGRVMDLNSAAECLTGWRSAEAVGRSIGEIFHIVNAKTREPAENPVERSLKEGVLVGLANHTVLISRNGKEYQIADSCAPIRSNEGDLMGAVLVFRDVTEAYQRREELALVKRRLEDILGITKTGIDILDSDFNLRYVDPAWQVVYGDPAGRKCYEYFMGRDEPCMGCGVLVALEKNEKVIREHVLPHEGGRVVEVHTIPFVDAEGERLVAEFNVDITERKLQEQEREKLHGQLIQSQKMESVGRLAGGIAHDFNNMLNVILGRSDLVLELLDQNHPLRSDIEEIHVAARRSAELTRRLLAFGRKQTVKPLVLDMNETVEGLLRMLRRLIGDGVRLEWRPGNRPAVVKMDPTQIDQVLVNLCVNARDAVSGSGTVTIEISNETLNETVSALNPDSICGDYIKLSVGDNGCGMGTEMLELIFEPFFTTKEEGKGTGLGLSVVYGIARQNGGFVRVRSELGKGSVFEVFFPAHGAIADVENVEHPSGNRHVCKRETILLVEDEKSILNLGKMILRDEGYTVISASSPGEALRFVREHSGDIDLLVTDVIMPGMNGRELAEKVMELRPTIKCLYVSGYSEDVIANKGVLDDSVPFLEKPFTIKSLSSKVRSVLDF